MVCGAFLGVYCRFYRHFLFGVGMETGNPIVRNVMEVLLANAFLVMAAFVLLNAAVLWVYYLRKQKTK